MKTRVQCASRAAHSRQAEARCCAERLEPRQLLAGELTGAFSGTVPTAFLPGGKNKVVVAVTNTGDTEVNDAFRIALFASTDGSLDSSDTRFAGLDKQFKLKPGGAKPTNVSFAFASPSNIPDGDYFLLAQIDETNGIPEGNENNNVAATGATVQIKQPFVDLTGTTDVSAGTISIVSGKKVKAPKVSLAVGNSGNVAANGTVTATIFASTNTTAGDSGDVQIGTVSKKLNTKPQKTTSLKPKITIPENLRTGTYNIVTTFSYAGTINESNSANNVAASAAQFTIDNPAFPAGADVSALSADSVVLAVNSPEQLIFDVSITNIPAGDTVTAELTEVTSDGTVIGKVADLLDNGLSTNSDATAADGIYTASTALQFSAVGDRFFRATIGGTTSSTTPAIKIAAINAPTELDIQETIDTANTRQAALSAAVGSGMTPTAAVQQSASSLTGQSDVVPGSIQMGSTAISYLNFKGILTYLSAKAAASTTSSTESAQLVSDASQLPLDCGCGDIAALAEGDLTTACSRAVVLGSFGPGFGRGGSAVRDLLLNPPTSDLPTQSSFNVSATLFDAGVDAFKGLGQNKFIYLEGETFGIDNNIAFKTGEVATTLDSISRAGDLVSGRVAISGGDNRYVLTPKFFNRYNGDLDGAIVIIDADGSTADNSLANPFLRRGAKAVYGFTGETSSGFDFNRVRTTETLRSLLTDQTVDQARTADLLGFGVGGVDPQNPNNEFTFFGTGEAKLEAGCDLLADNDLLISYSWNQNVRDLDTSTEFLGDTVGFSCGAGNQFMTFAGDNTSGGGSESITINLKGAFDDGRFTTSTMVSASAGWFSSAGGSGPAVLSVSLKNKSTGELSQTLTRTISPGTQSGCAATLVGNVTVSLTSETNPRVSITLA